MRAARRRDALPRCGYRLVTLPRLSSTRSSKDSIMVELHTNHGIIKLELDAEKAPKTVENFLNYVKAGHYDNTVFHRVIDGFMIQGGGFEPGMKQKPTGEPITNEANNGLKNVKGSIAMARTNDPHSATAQFFINVNDNDFLNHSSPTPQGWGYTVFGKVVEGLDVVEKIKKVKTGSKGFHQDVPVDDVVIEKAVIVE
jgi:peptidyl-prolyl cis-trans isomerase B (cyclophilin B)